MFVTVKANCRTPMIVKNLCVCVCVCVCAHARAHKGETVESHGGDDVD